MSRLDDDASRLAITSLSSSLPVLSSRLHPHHLRQLQQLGLTVHQRHQTLTSNETEDRAETYQRDVAEHLTNFASEKPSVRVYFDLDSDRLSSAKIARLESANSVSVIKGSSTEWTRDRSTLYFNTTITGSYLAVFKLNGILIIFLGCIPLYASSPRLCSRLFSDSSFYFSP